jgi:phage-related protein
MAGKNQVTLTFAGDSSKLESAFASVGESARKMDTDVGSASKTVGDSAAGFDRAGEAADGAEGKAQGFSDTLTGTKDLMGGVGEIAKGNLFEGFVLAGQGAADLAGGMAEFLIPMGKTAVLKAFAAGQWLVNAAMSANPIGLVIIAIVALIAIFILAWKKSETFRAIVTGALNGVLTIAKAVGKWFRETFWPWLKGVWEAVSGAAGTMSAAIGKTFTGLVKWLGGIPGRIGSALAGAWNGIRNGLGAAIGWISERISGLVSWASGIPGRIGSAVSGAWNGIRSGLSAAIGWVSERVSGLVDWAGKIPGRITSAVSGAFDGIKSAFATAINWVIDKWNNLSFSIPGVDTKIPGVGTIGGFTLNTPNIPTFHDGGTMPGAPGTEGLALLQAGERITPAGQGGGGVTIIVNGALDPIAVAQQIQQLLRKLKSTNGGLELGLA